MSGKVAHTLEEALKAVEEGKTRYGAARRLGCPYQTIDNYRKRWKSVDDAIKTKRTEMVDMAEMGVRGAVIKGQPWAIAFALKTLAKDDYSERQEVAQTGDITFRVIYEDSKPRNTD